MVKIKPINEKDSESEIDKKIEWLKMIEENMTNFCIEFFIYAIVFAIIAIIYLSIKDTIEFERLLKKKFRDRYTLK